MKIWKEMDIPTGDSTRVRCSHAISKKFPDKDSAVTALEELASNNFNASKYKSKQILSTKRTAVNKYVVQLKGDVTEIYEIATWRGE